MKKRALITGIAGQDGSNLADYLLSLDYEVFGTVRRHSVAENQDQRIKHLGDTIHTEYADLLDYASLEKIMELAKPDEIYHLAAQSHVRISFDIPLFTIQTNALGTANMLEAYRKVCPKARFYMAASSEMFGNCVDADSFQRETTPMHPVSPYGCSKIFGYSLVLNYRHAYKLWAANGILFNHTGPRRGSNFVEQKIVKHAVEIKKGLRDKLVLGNLDSCRDFGDSRDYVRAMYLILNHSEPDDFVIATGETHSVRELCEYVFTKLDMDYRDYVAQDPKFMRPEELKYLRGDSGKARRVLDWETRISFEQMLDDMIECWMNVI